MNFYKNSVIALTLSIISVSGALMYQSFMSNRVLGESIGSSGSYSPTSIPKPTNIVITAIPQPSIQPVINTTLCADLKVLSTKYCGGSITPSTYPTNRPLTPTPTVASCTVSLKSYSPTTTACAVNSYIAVYYECSDGYSNKVSPGKCTTISSLKYMATEACSSRSTCGQ